MIDLNVSALAPEVAKLLMLRGSGLPPLQWSDHPNRTAKRTLDGANEAAVLARDALADKQMAVAVRALLYLWNGWVAECAMCAQATPDKEQLYLAGICERQLGHAEAAKRHFQQCDGHSIYEPLAAYASKMIQPNAEPALKRFKEILELNSSWEPFAFVDLYEQTRAGRLSPAVEQAVCRLQCREFELLLAHCYEAATGERIPQRVAESVDVERIRALRRGRDKAARRRTTSVAGHEPMPDTPAEAPGAPLARFSILCPRCQAVIEVHDLERGQKRPCGICGGLFIVPQKKRAERPTSSPTGP